ncbi:hypothetical protein G7Y79_00003g008560 [Physcia stellaris]|nr:hypothetical protein G7Y79_00003g008560 [Physcia stellaris]
MEKRANPSSQLEVDHAILDYLLYSATKVLIHDFRKGSSEKGDRNKHEDCADTLLQLVDSFLLFFRSLHPGDHGTQELQNRLRLLKFTSLFCSRFASLTIRPSKKIIKRLRDSSTQRRKSSNFGNRLADTIETEGAAQGVNTTDSRDSGMRTSTNIYGPDHPISLIDTLPSFMALSAAQSVLQKQPVSVLWMRLAAGYMAHAALEQSLLRGVRLTDAVKEAFAWSYDPDLSAEQGTDEWAINAMFCDQEEEAEVLGWNDVKYEHIRTIMPPDGRSLQEHANELLAKELPIDALVERLLSFIEGMLKAQPKPLYTQLELGKVDGLSQRQTQALLGTIGMK